MLNLFPGAILQFKANPVEDQNWQNAADNHGCVVRDEIAPLNMVSCRMAAKEECQGQRDKDQEESQLDVGTKDGEPFAKTQGHDGAPGRPPDKKQGDDYLY